MQAITRYGKFTILLLCLLLLFSSRASANIIYGKGLFVTFGDVGTLLTSTDGITWIERNTYLAEPVASIAFGNDKFIAVGEHGTIFLSSDGVSWNRNTNVTKQIGEITLSSVTFGKGIFVAVGVSGSILTTKDGIIWKWQKSHTSSWLYGVTYGNGLFVAVGSDVIVTSSNGVTWKTRKSPVSNWLNAVVYRSGMFVAVGYETILTSNNGMAWKPQKLTSMCSLYGVTYDESRALFVAVGCSPYNHDSPMILRSENGSVWSMQSPEVTGCLTDVIYANGLLVAAGGYLDEMENWYRTILTSTDGVNWLIQHKEFILMH